MQPEMRSREQFLTSRGHDSQRGSTGSGQSPRRGSADPHLTNELRTDRRPTRCRLSASAGDRLAALNRTGVLEFDYPFGYGPLEAAPSERSLIGSALG